MTCDFEKSPVYGLKPELFWKHFFEITQVPRPSKHEEKIREYLVNFAKSKSLDYTVDKIGNVIIRKPASKGYENVPGVILQGHMDMVCEKIGDKEFDFMTQPLELIKEGNIIRANGTTLGSDNGAGVCAGLAVLEDDSIEHPALECFFTVDEETGMTGAKNLEPGLLKGKYLLNLDSEDEDIMFIGCAGGIDTFLEFIPEWKEDCKTCENGGVKITVKGLKGGHSGMEINEGRANALKLIARFLFNLRKVEDVKFKISSIIGGNKHNAIPREAEAVICTHDFEKVKAEAEKWQKIFAEEFKYVEDGIEIIVEEISNVGKVMTKESADKLLNTIWAIPHGVIRMDRAVKDLVETSTNLAILSKEGDNFKFEMSHRSSYESVKRAVCNRTEALGNLIGLKYSEDEGYPAWQPNFESKLSKIAQKAYKDSIGKDIIITVIHAGLECGIIMEKYPGMEAVSFGPTLRNVHTPDEHIEIESVEHFFKFLVKLLKDMKNI